MKQINMSLWTVIIGLNEAAIAFFKVRGKKCHYNTDKKIQIERLGH